MLVVIVKQILVLIPLHVINKTNRVADHLANMGIKLGNIIINESTASLEGEVFMQECNQLVGKDGKITHSFPCGFNDKYTEPSELSPYHDDNNSITRQTSRTKRMNKLGHITALSHVEHMEKGNRYQWKLSSI